MKKLLALILVTSAVQADIVPTQLSLTLSSYNFTPGITFGQQIRPGDYFEILDIPTLLGVTSIPVDWAYTIELLSPQPAGIVVPDSPAIDNIRFTYSGAPQTGPQFLGLFDLLVEAESSLEPRLHNWIGAAHQIPILGGQPDANLNSVPVPVETNVPEAAPNVMAFSLLALLAIRRKLA
jgi:hypothetical protein